MRKYLNEIFTKEKNKYIKVNEFNLDGIHILNAFCNFYERKLDGEKIRIVKHYNYYETMQIDVYFSNGYKYVYYDIPCNSGARINGYKLIEEVILK